MAINFFTWNVKNNNNSVFYSDLNKELILQGIDILVLQECSMKYPITNLSDFDEIPEFVAEKGKKYVRVFLNKNSKIAYSYPVSYLNNKIKCLKIKTYNGNEFNIIGVHLYSKVGKTSSNQDLDNLPVRIHIDEYQALVKNDKTVILGDFNYHPFEANMLHPKFLNALNDKHLITALKTRKGRAFDVKYYYNPMWNLLGDFDYQTGGYKISGTYYWVPKDIKNYPWNLFDGVILSPEIMNELDMKSLKVITKISTNELVKSIPYTSSGSLLHYGHSDHLPIKFNLNII
ncbi:endonuclease/exonuclease/phosphatase family protein [Pedobacter cryotolerans]|uniref:endonuclease/exonuclease/phosphatase family protein n=1 Tax=Pedobacter cryotolerans TaxID=2571270 RepID=UPI00268457E5